MEIKNFPAWKYNTFKFENKKIYTYMNIKNYTYMNVKNLKSNTRRGGWWLRIWSWPWRLFVARRIERLAALSRRCALIFLAKHLTIISSSYVFICHDMKFRIIPNNIIKLEVRGPSGPQLLVGGLSGRLDFVLRALRALRPRLTHQTRLTHRARQILSPTNQRTRRF